MLTIRPNLNQRNRISFKSSLPPVRNELTNEMALNLLGKKLTEGMPKRESESWVAKIKQACKKFGIAPKDLPISKEHPGALSPENTHNIFTEIFHSVFSDSGIAKIELKPKAN